jgi:hypothetical protein
MNHATTITCALFCGMAFAALLPQHAVAESPRAVVGYRFEHIERIEFDDSNPIRPAFDWGRFAGERHLLTFGMQNIAGGYVGGLLGPATHEVHNGEGETVEYDTICFGAEGVWHWLLLPQQGVGGLIVTRGLMTTKDSGHITEVAAHDAAVTVDSRSELSWWELSFLASLTHTRDQVSLQAGLEYVMWNVDQKWSLATGNTSTDLEPDTSLGLLLGGRYQCTQDIAVTFDVTLIHQVSFRTGVTYEF